MAEKDKVFTIRDMLEAGKIKPTSVAWKRIVDAGFDVNEPFTALKDLERLKGLAKVGGSTADYKKYLAGQNIIAQQAQLFHDQQLPDVFGSKGLIRAKESPLRALLPKAEQSRKSDVLKAVPEAKASFPEIAKGLATVPDPDVRAALAFNAFIPLRPGEVASLKISDINFETGEFFSTDDRGTKVRNKLRLPPFALAILEAQADKAKEAGHEHLFFDERKSRAMNPAASFRSKMTTEFNREGGIKTLLSKYESVFGRPLKGSKDFRKIIPSITAVELGYAGQVSAIMGHDDLGGIANEMKKMTTDFYVSGVVKIGEDGKPIQQISEELIALRGIENTYAKVLGLKTINELAGVLNLDLPKFTGKGAPKYKVAQKGESLDTTEAQTDAKGTRTVMEDSDIADVEKRRDAVNAGLERDTARANREALDEKIATAERMANPDVQRKLIEGEKATIRLEEQTAAIRAQAKAELEAESKPQVELTEATKSKIEEVRERLAKLADSRVTKTIVGGLPIVGIPLAASQRVEAAEQRIAAGEGTVPAYLKEGARFVAEEFTPLGLPIAAAEIGSEIHQSTKETLEKDVAKRSQITDVNDFGTEMQMRNLFEQKRNMQ